MGWTDRSQGRPSGGLQLQRQGFKERAVIVALGVVLAGFLVVPLLALLLSVSLSELWAGLNHPLVWPALELSLFTSTVSLAFIVLFGTPLAWSIAQSQARWVRWVETGVQMPIVIPPAVAGIALLLAFGPEGTITGSLFPAGWSLSLTTTAVIVAQVFVAAPFFVQAATGAFRRLDPKLLWVARSFGATPLRVLLRVGVPLASPALLAGGVMSWARALGEFGATALFAGKLPGKTQTLSLAIYTELDGDRQAAQALSVVLVGVAFSLLLGVRVLLHRAVEGQGGAQ